MIYRFYQSGNGTAINSVAIDGRMDDQIQRVYFDFSITVPTDGEQFYAELSWISSIQRGLNDANSVAATIQGGIELTTSGLGIATYHHEFVFDTPPRWEGGEKLYMHYWTTNSTVLTCYTTVLTAGQTGKVAAKRR